MHQRRVVLLVVVEVVLVEQVAEVADFEQVRLKIAVACDAVVVIVMVEGRNCGDCGSEVW